MMPLTMTGSAIKAPGVLNLHLSLSMGALLVLRVVSLGLLPWWVSLYRKRGQSPDEAKGLVCAWGEAASIFKRDNINNASNTMAITDNIAVVINLCLLIMC